MRRAGCPFCDPSTFRDADVYIENDLCVFATTRDPRDPPDVLPGCGLIVPAAHRPSVFDLTSEEWAATRDLLLRAKADLDESLAPDGYLLAWNAFPPAGAEDGFHAHFHVIPRFDDEPLAGEGARSAIKVEQNRRPDPFAPGNGRARLLGTSAP